MNSETPKGGVATPESLPPITQTTPKEGAPAPGPTYQYPYPSAANRYPPQRSREPGNSHGAAWIIGSIVAFLLLAGLLLTLVVGLIAGIAMSTIGQHVQSTTTSKTFVVTGTPSLVISDSAGNVTVQQGGGNQVTVRVTKYAWGVSDTAAKGALQSIVVNVSQSGNTINVTTQLGSGLGRRSADLTVTVPAATNADVHLGAGNIDARQLSGAIRLDTGAGNVTAEAVNFAGTSRLHTGAGNITVDGAIASGTALDVLVGAGNATLTLPSDTPAHLTASTGVGNLTITGWQIPVTGAIGHTASGNLGSNPTGALTIQVGTGNLVLMSR
jgi:hypothetical protein